MKGELHMKELLFFILGMMVGSLFATTIMCFLQINRINKLSIENNDEEVNGEKKANKKTNMVK